MTARVRRFPDLAHASQALARHLTERARAAVRRRGTFSLVLAGGSTPETLYRSLARSRSFPWGRTELFFGDERGVGPRSPESNYRMARTSLIAPAQLGRSQVHRIHGELRPLSRAAARYEAELEAWRIRRAPEPLFDSVLLGLGPDGHTASLFPESPALHERHHLAVAVRVPAQAPRVPRITLTLPALASSREVCFLVSGEGKADAVRRVLGGRPAPRGRLPAARVRSQGPVVWYLDREAAAGLPRAR